MVMEVMSALEIQNGSRIISKNSIKESLLTMSKGTEISALEKKKVPGKNISLLDSKLDQAFYQLNLNKKIKSHGYGLWSLVDRNFAVNLLSRTQGKYKPRICQALEKDNYCPMTNTYIGNPIAQCGLLHGSNPGAVTTQHGSGMTIAPMKPCYFALHPKELGKQLAKLKIQKFEERQKRMMVPTTHGF